jgi:pyruvate/2-oxoglutarate dehydrogenase complex dihydrolipoamide dehydrogenase (E3) component
MSQLQRVENVVIGGGEAGKYVAWELAANGRKVVVIERELIGGSCPNIACLPSKNVIRSAEVAHLVGRAADYGVQVGSNGSPVVDIAQVRERKRTLVTGLVATHQKRFDHENIEFLLASGSLEGPKTVVARAADGTTRRFEAERLFLNLGTRPALPSIPGLAEAEALTHIEALELGHLPRHLVVLGGGYIGVEFAQAYRRFGSEVTIVQSGARLLNREDPDVSDAVREVLEDEGVRVLTRAATQRVEGRSSESVQLTIQDAAGRRVVSGTDLLVATGRSPNTRGIGLEAVGIELDDRGYIRVDDRLHTSVPGVWALGDCAGSHQFTHVAFDDFRVVRDELAGGAVAGSGRTTRARLVPHAVFIDPELAHVGLNESTAAREGVPVRVARLPMATVLRARCLGETRGSMKMLVAADSDEILGFTMLGHGASEVVSVVQMAMLGGLPYSTVRDTIFTHPTMAEGLTVLLTGLAPA